MFKPNSQKKTKASKNSDYKNDITVKNKETINFPKLSNKEQKEAKKDLDSIFWIN